jgi:hypothetical protein
MAHQIRYISKDRLTGKCGFIDNDEIKTEI